MRHSSHYLPSLFQVLMLIGMAVLLSACAGRPKPLDPMQPITVTEVRVTAARIEDFGFADRLQQRLEASVGRSTSDIGQASMLQIVVRDWRADSGWVWFFNSQAQAVTLELIIIDANTGQLMRTRELRTISSNTNGQGAENALIGRLVDDIRALLGLSGYPLFPVTGAKRQVAVPLDRPETITDAAFLSADPLLNGTITPTTVNYDPESTTVPVLDISRPMLDVAPATEEPKAEKPLTPPVVVKVPQNMKAPMEELDTVTAPTPGGNSEDEPCIVTLDNDCGDPDSR